MVGFGGSANVGITDDKGDMGKSDFEAKKVRVMGEIIEGSIKEWGGAAHKGCDTWGEEDMGRERRKERSPRMRI